LAWVEKEVNFAYSSILFQWQYSTTIYNRLKTQTGNSRKAQKEKKYNMQQTNILKIYLTIQI
jgi:hypothetical protein